MKLILLLPLLFSCTNPAPAPAQEAYTNLTVQEAKEVLADENVILLDVRTPAETARGKIEGATEIDYRDPDFAAKISALDRQPTYLVYCAVGGRSSRTCELMAEAGFDRLYNLEGGYTAWSQR
jgi:rhodanese-related sulfurtransferase